jgi:hypothetical protein
VRETQIGPFGLVPDFVPARRTYPIWQAHGTQSDPEDLLKASKFTKRARYKVSAL